MQTTAPSWDSFKDVLYKVLQGLNPKTVFEYGPGVSTSIMAIHPSVDSIDSVEHDKAWYEKYRWEMPENVTIHFQPNLELYPETKGRLSNYDLIFIDGRKREECLYISKVRLNPGGVIILHDAERFSYQEPMKFYRYRFFLDGGHTAVLTDNTETASRLESIFDA